MAEIGDILPRCANHPVILKIPGAQHPGQNNAGGFILVKGNQLRLADIAQTEGEFLNGKDDIALRRFLCGRHKRRGKRQNQKRQS